MGDLGFNEWFKVFLDEKGLSETVIEFDDPNKRAWVFMPIKIIQDFLAICSPQTQAKFKAKVIKLDFCNMELAHLQLF